MIARCRLFGRRVCCADFYGCQLTLAMRVRYDTHSSLPTMVLTNRFKGSGIRLSQLRWGAPLLYVLAMNLRPALDVTFIEAHRRVRPAVTFACIVSIRVTPPPRNSQQTLLAGQSILQFNALRVKEVDYMLETERLTLRAWAETDAESLYAYAKDPDIGPIAGWPARRSKEESLNTIRHVLNGKECYAICERGSNNPIGSIELKLNGHTDMTDRDDEREAWSVPWKSPTIRRLCRYLHTQHDGALLECFGRVLVGFERMLVKTL